MKEQLASTNENGEFDWKWVDRESAHREWLWHKSIHGRAIDPNKERYWWDVGIYVSTKSDKKSITWKWYLEKTFGGHIDFNDIGSWFKNVFLSKILEENPKLKNNIEDLWENWFSISITTFLREIAEELSIVLSEDWNSDKEKNKITIKNINLILANEPYATIKKDWNEIKEINNEHIDVYTFEVEWDIKNFDTQEISNVEIYTSKELQKILETQAELFGIKDIHSPKAKVLKKILDKIQKDYDIKP